MSIVPLLINQLLGDPTTTTNITTTASPSQGSQCGDFTDQYNCLHNSDVSCAWSCSSTAGWNKHCTCEPLGKVLKIVGCVAGGIVAVVAIIFFYFWFKKRNSRPEDDAILEDERYHVVTGFSATQSRTASTIENGSGGVFGYSGTTTASSPTTYPTGASYYGTAAGQPPPQTPQGYSYYAENNNNTSQNAVTYQQVGWNAGPASYPPPPPQQQQQQQQQTTEYGNYPPPPPPPPPQQGGGIPGFGFAPQY